MEPSFELSLWVVSLIVAAGYPFDLDAVADLLDRLAAAGSNARA
jgi:hypothetical protein